MKTDDNIFKDQDIPYAEFPNADNSRFGSEVDRDVKELQVGAGSTVFRANESGIWLGAKRWASAPFRVDMNGNVVATSITLGAQYTTPSQVTTIIGNTVTTGYVNALSIVAGSVAAENITGNVITGKTLQTATSGIRVLINSTGLVGQISFFDSSNNYVGSMFGASTSLFIRGVLGIGFTIGSSGFGTVVGAISTTGLIMTGSVAAGTIFACNGSNGITTTVTVAHGALVGAYYTLVFKGGILTSANFTP